MWTNFLLLPIKYSILTETFVFSKFLFDYLLSHFIHTICIFWKGINFKQTTIFGTNYLFIGIIYGNLTSLELEFSDYFLYEFEFFIRIRKAWLFLSFYFCLFPININWWTKEVERNFFWIFVFLNVWFSILHIVFYLLHNFSWMDN